MTATVARRPQSIKRETKYLSGSERQPETPRCISARGVLHGVMQRGRSLITQFVVQHDANGVGREVVIFLDRMGRGQGAGRYS